ncbi:hypothetical protein ACHQM5_002544 [Ranunculus cassubicifolius]
MPPLTNNKTGSINDERRKISSHFHLSVFFRFDKQVVCLSKTAPPKKQRVPPAYNQFIKEEIQRVKANNPAIAHRDAFSTAAKNWANFPRVRYEG